MWVSIENYKYGSLLLSLNTMGSLRVDREPGRMLPSWPLLLAKPSWLLQKCALWLLKGLPSALPGFAAAPLCGTQFPLSPESWQDAPSYSEALPVSSWKTQSKTSPRSRKPCLLSHRAERRPRTAPLFVGEGLRVSSHLQGSTPHLGEGLCVSD